MTKRKKKSDKKKPKVHEELESFDLNIDSFGEIKSSLDIDRINEFLNKKVEDKKLKDKKKPKIKKSKT